MLLHTSLAVWYPLPAAKQVLPRVKVVSKMFSWVLNPFTGGGRSGNLNSAPTPTLMLTFASTRTRGPSWPRRPGSSKEGRLEVKSVFGAVLLEVELLYGGVAVLFPGSVLQFGSAFCFVERCASSLGRSIKIETPASSWSRNSNPMGIVGRKASPSLMSMSVTFAENGRGWRVALGKPTTPLPGRSVSSTLMFESFGT